MSFPASASRASASMRAVIASTTARGAKPRTMKNPRSATLACASAPSMRRLSRTRRRRASAARLRRSGEAPKRPTWPSA